MASDYRQSETPPDLPKSPREQEEEKQVQSRPQTAPSIAYSHPLLPTASKATPSSHGDSTRRIPPLFTPTSYPIVRSDSLDGSSSSSSTTVPLPRPSLPTRSISLAAAAAPLSGQQQQGIIPHRRPNGSPSAAEPSRADVFMASLLRAAESRDVDPHHRPQQQQQQQQQQQHQQQHQRQHLAPLQPRIRPMSVSSMVDEMEVNHPSRTKRQRMMESSRADTVDAALERQSESGVTVRTGPSTHPYQSHSAGSNSNSSTTSTAAPSAVLLSLSKVSPPSNLQPLPRTSAAMPSYTSTYSPPGLERKLSGQLPPPTFDWTRTPASSFSSSSGTSSSSHQRAGPPAPAPVPAPAPLPPPPTLPSRSIYTNDSSFTFRGEPLEHKVSSSSSSSSSATSQYAASSSLFAKKSGGSHSTVHEHNSRSPLVARAMEEEQQWSSQTEKDRRMHIRDNILLARSDLASSSSSNDGSGKNGTAPWPRNNSTMTSVRCMYANIAQKSYGSEKRFLCPPPVVKIDGPLRPCKWAIARVVSGDCPTPSSMSLRSSQAGPEAGGASTTLTLTSGEEEATIDSTKEARFGKLHVGSLSESKGKTFRLQLNLLRSEEADDNIRATTRDDSHPSRAMAAGAWSTFHSAPISVISKPARKSARTRAASPAIVSGSIVCLYNRLNSQTVRTKYLSVEAEAEEAGSISSKSDVRKLIARQDGWEGFAIDLLARPYKESEASRWTDRGEIAYGCIVCLRDVNTNVCSEPMLICKVEKGRVDVSSIAGGSVDDGPMQYEMVGRDKMAVREILAGARRRTEVVLASGQAAAESSSLSVARQESPEGSSGSPSSTILSTGGQGPSTDGAVGLGSSSGNSIPGGAVVQMQKVTLMQVSPRLGNGNFFECDLASPRLYLSSTAFEGVTERYTCAALARSKGQLQSRLQAMQERGDNVDYDEPQLPSLSSARPPGQASLFPVGFVCPPVDLSKGSERVVDVLEDPYCWTIVTISQSEISFIEANARSPTSSPHIPAGLLPITPFPSVAALPSYDHQSHAIAATIHDFYYNPHSQSRAVVNHLCATSTPATSHDNMAHEIWLGHSGPLNYRSASAGPFMSDVTFQLPSLAHLQTLHAEFHSSEEANDGRLIRLPILFVRASQGITFVSGHWLRATYCVNDSSSRLATPAIDTSARWRVAID